MKHNFKMHDRKSIRLKGYDYSLAGAYFITLNCQDKKHRFGQVENGEMNLNEFGEIALDEWLKLSERFSNFHLGTFQIMPDHLHAIIVLNNSLKFPVGATPVVATRVVATRVVATLAVAPSPKAKTIGDIIGAYKSLVMNNCLKIYKSKNEVMGKFWQRNYYERIIRNEQAYINISNYILDNPKKWEKGKQV